MFHLKALALAAAAVFATVGAAHAHFQYAKGCARTHSYHNCRLVGRCYGPSVENGTHGLASLRMESRSVTPTASTTTVATTTTAVTLTTAAPAAGADGADITASFPARSACNHTFIHCRGAPHFPALPWRHDSCSETAATCCRD
jgi:hypothetical protein